MLRGPDLNSWKASFSFADAVAAERVDFAYIKLGGNNIASSSGIRSPYVSGSYVPLVDDARAHVAHVGHMWVTGGVDPAGSARFVLQHLHDYRPGTDFIVLDNETLDDGRTWTDGECAVFWDTLGDVGPNRFQYSSKYNFTDSSLVIARGVRFISADYNGIEDIASAVPDVLPASLVIGHQFADNYQLGGLAVDYNVFTDDAFQGSAPAPAAPPPPTDKAHPMLFIQHAPTGAIAVVFPWMNNGKGTYRHVNAAEWAAATAAGYKFAALADPDWAEIMTEMVPVSGVVGQ